jgi:hypothetical protein
MIDKDKEAMKNLPSYHRPRAEFLEKLEKERKLS